MNRRYDNLILIFLVAAFFFLFRFNTAIKDCVINAITAWLTNLVPFLFPAYILIDLMLNYGLTNKIYNIFKSNIPIIVILSLLLGCPSNAKYIRDFYRNGYISLGTANYLLTFAYSPNPLFILGIAPPSIAFKTILFIYSSNLILAIIFHSLKEKENDVKRLFDKKPFVSVLESSIYKTFKILILILGIIIVYAIINLITDSIMPGSHYILKSILEITNACLTMQKTRVYKWFVFACTFGGLSIHTQIKSILDDTPISYKYFFFGRAIASILAFFFTFIF